METKSKFRQLGLVPAGEIVLDTLGLPPAEKQALLRQGFVRAERRGRRRVTYRLCFRSNGRQCTRSLGSDVQRAQAVQEMLTAYQRGRRAELRLKFRLREARALMRGLKQRLAKDVRAAGLSFHGRTIRRPRKKMKDNRQGGGIRHRESNFSAPTRSRRT